MKSIAIKLACVAVLAASLTGCIMYVSPDKDYDYDKSPPASANEKPAEVMSTSPSF